jgi:integrase
MRRPGRGREPRQLKHRARKEVRVVPCPPPLVQLLRRHLAEHGTAPDGRLFRGERGGPISDSVYSRVWERARTAALSSCEAASPLADRPYSLRHAAVSTWLNAGVDPTQVADWAGHSVNVLLRVYAKCDSGRELVARQLVEIHPADSTGA